MRTPQNGDWTISLSLTTTAPHQRGHYKIPNYSNPSRLHFPCRQVADIHQPPHTFLTQPSRVSIRFPPVRSWSGVAHHRDSTLGVH